MEFVSRGLYVDLFGMLHPLNWKKYWTVDAFHSKMVYTSQASAVSYF